MSDRYVKAWNDYTRSESFLKSSEPSTIGASEVQRHFLENRLKHAFDEGWNRRAAAEVDREALVGLVKEAMRRSWDECAKHAPPSYHDAEFDMADEAVSAMLAYLAEREGRA